jgi:hypothetical protein
MDDIPEDIAEALKKAAEGPAPKPSKELQELMDGDKE